MSKPASHDITLADLKLTTREQELFASGARHLFGADETPTDEDAEPTKPKGTPKPTPKRLGQLVADHRAEVLRGGGQGARKN